MRVFIALPLLAGGLAVAAQEGHSSSVTLPAPPDVRLRLELREARSQYRLGELIPLRLSYISEVPGKYVKTGVASDLQNGQPESLSCEPANLTGPGPNADSISLGPFLYAEPGCKVGVGSGSGGSCIDCHGFLTLGPAPLSYEFDLNREVRLLHPGRYVCTATNSNVALAAQPAEQRSALQLRSNPVSLDVVEDSAWSRMALAEAQVQIKATCDDNPSPPVAEGERWLHCVHAAEVLRFLDTDDSLRAAVTLLHGNGKAYWQTEMWEAISQSSNRELAIDLLSLRMLEGDFAVTDGFLETLGAWRLRLRHPEAFATDGHAVHPEVYNGEAMDLLRASVRALGRSLPEKRGTAVTESAKTYRTLATRHDCRDRPLVPESEARASLTAAKQ